LSEETANAETENVVEPEAPVEAVSELPSKKTKAAKAEAPAPAPVEEVAVAAEPVGIVTPNTAIENLTYANTNFFYPFLRQVYNPIGFNPNPPGGPWAAVNNGGLVFQNGQYNTTQRGF